MTKYILDTNICVFGLRGQFDIIDRIKSVGAENLCISEITVMELFYGVEKSANKEKQWKITEDFINGLEVIPISNSIYLYAAERAHLEKIGKPLHDYFDLIIGVTAVVHDFILVTDNQKHFQNIRNLLTENWATR